MPAIVLLQNKRFIELAVTLAILVWILNDIEMIMLSDQGSISDDKINNNVIQAGEAASALLVINRFM